MPSERNRLVPSKKIKRSVIVIGAGLSGLSAALELQEMGLSVQVIEANNRAGGRIHSMQHFGANREAGGTYIGSKYKMIIEFAKKNNIDLIDISHMISFFKEQDFVLDNEIITQKDWPSSKKNIFPEKFKNIMPWSLYRVLTKKYNPLNSAGEWLDKKNFIYDIPFDQWLKNKGFSEDQIKLVYGINVSYGLDAKDISTLLLLYRAAFSSDQKIIDDKVIGYTALNGVNTFTDIMSSQLEKEIHFNKNVLSINSGRNETSIHCEDGSHYVADHVICSVPLSVLRGILFHPALPKKQYEAIKNIPYQPMTQIYFRHKSKFWELDEYNPSFFSNSLVGMFSATRNRDNPKEITSFTSWIFGKNAIAIDKLSKKEAAELITKTIENIRPSSKDQLEFIDLMSWGNEKFSKGAWAYYRPGQIRDYANILGNSHNNIHFCGEHLAKDNRGMEGAMESGISIARKLIQS